MSTVQRALVHTIEEIENLLQRRLTPITDNLAALRELGFERAYPQVEHGYDAAIWERAIVGPRRSRDGLRVLIRQRAFLERPR